MGINVILGIAGLLVLVVLILMFRVQSLLAVQRGSAKRPGGLTNKINGALFSLFFGIGIVAMMWYTFTGDYTVILNSEHGAETDQLFLVTMVILFVVVIFTHILIGAFTFKYQYNKERKAKFFPDNHKLELIWTIIPAIVLTFLVFTGWQTWKKVMYNNLDEGAVEVEVVGQQFEWNFRYPGADGDFGKHDFRRISGDNPLGLDFTKPGNLSALDDIYSQDLIIPNQKDVLALIRAKDVIHSFYLPQHRVKMDAVPGMPTSFRFKAIKTTQEQRNSLNGEPKWMEEVMTDEGVMKPKWETYNYELACAEICGSGHYKMVEDIFVETEEDFQAWLDSQTPWSVTNAEYVRTTVEESNMDQKYKDEYLSALSKLEAKYSSEESTEEEETTDEGVEEGEGNATEEEVVEEAEEEVEDIVDDAVEAIEEAAEEAIDEIEEETDSESAY